jgi:capsular exopolysaccharide synthesis family protein
MSRIHEALKKAEDEKSPTRRASGVGPLDFADYVAEPPAPGTLDPLSQGGAPTPEVCLRIEDLRGRCAKPGWNLDPDYDVFSAKQSFLPCAEQFRTLRSRLYRHREKNPIRTLLVTSTLPGEGKTFVALNLALSITRQHERRALLIDADLRASRLHTRMGAPSAPGLSDYLNGKADEFSVIQADPKAELFLIPAGTSVPNPAELLANGLLKGFLDYAGPAFDWIILDAPPVLAVSDPGVLAEICDGVIVVIRAGATAHDLVQKTLQEFRGKNLLGVVLNRAEEEMNYGAYSSYAGYGMDTK